MSNTAKIIENFANMLQKSMFWFAIAFLFHPYYALADSQSILITFEEKNEFVTKLVSSLQSELKESIPGIQLNISDSPEASIKTQPGYGLVITIGTKASDSIIRTNTQTPVLSILLPKQSWQQISQNQKRSGWYTIVLDQPINRQLLLINNLFGNGTVIGTIFGNDSLQLKKELENRAERNQQLLVTRTLDTTDQLMPVLRDLSGDMDVLLAIPDSDIYNKQTIQGILLLTYRNKIPLIGFSQAYVKAGAAVALHSEPDQIAKHGAELARSILSGIHLEEMHYPKYFTVTFNQQVAKTLGMDLPDPALLVNSIMAKENQKP